MRAYVVCILLLLFPCMQAYAGEADVVAVKAMKTGDGTYQFDVAVSHGDEGWDHYADKWEVVGSDGTVLGTRTLYHPHVNEQPFTRSLSDVKIPTGMITVTVRAHDSVHDYGGKVSTTIIP